MTGVQTCALPISSGNQTGLYWNVLAWNAQAEALFSGWLGVDPQPNLLDFMFLHPLACAGPIPKADPSEAWIGLKEEAPNDLMAERVDGKRVDDGRFFEVPPGAHRLDVTLFEEEPGDDNQRRRPAPDHRARL